MSIKTIVPIKLHKSAKRKEFEGKVTSIELDKPEFFKYAVYVREVIQHVKESDFDYLQSLVPHMVGYYDDLIELTGDKIINLCKDDRTQQQISELAGVAIGLKYSTSLLDIGLNKFEKIGVPVDGKYMDYKVVVDGKLYEMEAKGTTQPSFSKMVKDIIAKKSFSGAHLKFGTIAAIEGHRYSRKVRCVVVDDPPIEGQLVEADYFRNQLSYYAVFLGFILDPKYYNRYANRVADKAFPRRSIAEGKFFGRYEFNGSTYLGECFDNRLIRRNVEMVLENRTTDIGGFDLLTQIVGKTKFFIGLDEKVISAINRKDREFMENYRSERIFNTGDSTYQFLDVDGILIVKSKGGADEQLESIFTEEDVQKRLDLYEQYIRGIAHECGQPCHSPGIVGKSCAIRTFREACHWHR